MKTLVVATEFSKHPGGRYVTEGPWSGELFRESFLLGRLEECMATATVLRVDFDGVVGAPTSFLEESFGGIFRARPDWTLDQVQSALVIEAPRSPGLAPFMELARQYMVRAAGRRS
jgi:hypothetical protein